MKNSIIAEPKNVIYTGRTYTIGGRDGKSISSDTRLNMKLSIPGSAGTGTNPEQLLAAGWSACFIGALSLAAAKMNVKLPEDTALDTEVDLCLSGESYSLQARLNVYIPEFEYKLAKAITANAFQTCPFSKAIKDNIRVKITTVKLAKG